MQTLQRCWSTVEQSEKDCERYTTVSECCVHTLADRSLGSKMQALCIKWAKKHMKGSLYRDSLDAHFTYTLRTSKFPENPLWDYPYAKAIRSLSPFGKVDVSIYHTFNNGSCFYNALPPTIHKVFFRHQ